jgi:hypothetical protein
MRAYKFVTTLEPGGHDVYSAKKEGAPSRWGVRQDVPAKAAARRRLKKINRREMSRFESSAEKE